MPPRLKGVDMNVPCRAPESKPRTQEQIVCEGCGKKDRFELAKEDLIDDYGNYYYGKFRFRCVVCGTIKIITPFNKIAVQTEPGLRVSQGVHTIEDSLKQTEEE